MISAASRAPGRFPAPTKIEDQPGLIEEFRFDADGTAYRVVVVTVAPDSMFVLAEPCGMGNPRGWMPLGDSDNPLAVTYVASKLGINARGQDAHNLTLLIAYAIQRPALVWDAEGEGLEERIPA